MRFFFIFCFLLAFCADSTYSSSQNGNDMSQSVKSSMTNNSFSFKVFKKHPIFNTIQQCYQYIYNNYDCQTHDLKKDFVAAVISGDKTAFVNTFSSFVDKMGSIRVPYALLMEAEDPNNFFYPSEYKALLAYIWSSKTFSIEISQRQSPGIWSCYLDYLVEEYKDVNKKTLEQGTLLEGNKAKTLYSGIQNSLVFNFTLDDGSLNVRNGSLVTVSGYLSTTDDRSVAIKFGKGYTGAPMYPVILEIIPLKEKSKAADLYSFVLNNTQREFLFPTNVVFKVVDTKSGLDLEEDYRDAGFLHKIIVQETETQSIQEEVNSPDPNEGEYTCKRGISSAPKLGFSFVLLITIIVFL